MASLVKRNKTYYAQYLVAGKQKRISLNTKSLQLAKEKLRQLGSALFRGADSPLPTKTPLPDILERYLFQLKARTTEKNLQKVTTYLRCTFGEISESLKIRNAKVASKAVKRPSAAKIPIIEITYLEQITTEEIAAFLAAVILNKGVTAKTINHYRQNLYTLCSWAMTEGGVRFPGGKNPVERVRRYKEVKKDIRFLRDHDIDAQLQVLAEDLLLQTMVAVYIFAGLRREEALWLMPIDFEWDIGNYGIIRIRDKECKGNKWVPKTRSNRIVPISSTLRRYLDGYRKQGDLGTWFFQSPEGCRWDPDNFSRYLRGTNEKHSLAWGCLDFRHTFGSHLAMKGDSLYKIAKLMGNSPQICEKHYAALLPESLYETVEFPCTLSNRQPDNQPPAGAAEDNTAPARPRLRLVISR